MLMSEVVCLMAVLGRIGRKNGKKGIGKSRGEGEVFICVNRDGPARI